MQPGDEPLDIHRFPPAVRRIICEEARIAGVPVQHVLSGTQQRDATAVRFAIWWRQRAMLTTANGDTLSYPQLGRQWQRDHTTILHGVGVYEHERYEDWRRRWGHDA